MPLASQINHKTVNVLGLDIHPLAIDQVIDAAEHHIEKKEPLLLGVVNVAKLVRARKDPRLRQSLCQSDLILADGLPIVWLCRLTGKPLPQRVPGIDIMTRLFETAARNNYSVYLLGARPQVIEAVVKVVRRKYPSLRIAGFHHGYFNQNQQQQVAEDIKNSGCDILFVAMSSPKKENFLAKYRAFMNVPLCHGVGGAFDILAGFKKRAPLWMQNCGMEWFYRLMQEPKRMWKRYLVTNSIFIILSLMEVARGREK